MYVDLTRADFRSGVRKNPFARALATALGRQYGGSWDVGPGGARWSNGGGERVWRIGPAGYLTMVCYDLRIPVPVRRVRLYGGAWRRDRRSARLAVQMRSRRPAGVLRPVPASVAGPGWPVSFVPVRERVPIREANARHAQVVAAVPRPVVPADPDGAPAPRPAPRPGPPIWPGEVRGVNPYRVAEPAAADQS